jgi:very-short-patch-repair endonuclease
MTIGDHAKDNRNNPTEPELRLWRHFSRSQLGGFKFRRQHVIGGRIVDFFCPAVALVIEIDGHTHDAELDRARDAALASRGYVTLRFTNVDVMQNIEGVLETILERAQSLPLRQW